MLGCVSKSESLREVSAGNKKATLIYVVARAHWAAESSSRGPSLLFEALWRDVTRGGHHRTAGLGRARRLRQEFWNTYSGLTGTQMLETLSIRQPSTMLSHPLRDWRFMKYAIIGSGKIGTALARTFARKNIEVAIANSRGPETLASLPEELGPSVFPQSVKDAHQAEIIFLAVPFPAHKDVARQFKQWNGKIVVEVTNALHVAPKQLGGLLSSEVVSQAFVGARLVKAFNHLPAAQLGTNPSLEGRRQVVFISSNDADASATVAAVATQLGFAPIELGRLDKGGVPLHALDGGPGGLLFQNVEKLIGENYE